MGKLCCKEAPIRATTRPVVEIEGFTSVDEVKKWRRDATLLFKCFKLDEKIIINRRGANAIVPFRANKNNRVNASQQRGEKRCLE